jgi:hypothetical protein
MSVDLTKFGGRPMYSIGAGPETGAEPSGYNFGVIPAPPPLVQTVMSTPTLHQRYPRIAGAWDGKTTVNHVDAILKNHSGDWKKVEELIQNQPRGTCGGRAGSAAGDFMQHIMIASGKKATFYRVSHAAVYYMARKLYGWIGNGNWRDDNDDGVASGSVPTALARMGAVHREEGNDERFYGEGSDDLACQLVCGMHNDLASKMLELGSDNLITDWVRVSSAQELADGIAAGGIGIGSDMQGFTTTRDSSGFCSPRGTWAHYHIRVSVGNWKGRKGFGYWQSWGKNNPSGGTMLPGHPGNCFGVDFEVQDRVVRNGEWAVVFGFPLWELESGNLNLPWIF